MKKRPAALILALFLSFCLFSCAKEQTPEIPAAAPAEEALPEAPWCAVAVSFDKEEILIRGEKKRLSAKPFTENGTLFLPAGEIAALLGGSFVSAGDVWYLNFLGNVSAMMEEYNVLLFNTESFIMDSTPVLRESVLYLPAEGLGRALSMRVSLSAGQRICAFGSGEDMNEKQLAALRVSLGETPLPDVENAEIALISAQSGAPYDTLLTAAAARTLYAADKEGKISRLRLNADGELLREEVEIPERYPADGVFIAGKDGIFGASDGAFAGKVPETLLKEELREATARYMELSAQYALAGDENIPPLMEASLAAAGGELENKVYISDKNAPYPLTVFDGSGTEEETFRALYDKARVGDFLLFRAQGAGAEYGCFNHAALVIEKNEGELRLLQARGAQYGVGADLPMDILSFETLNSVDFWLGYGEIFLCTAGELNDAARQEMADFAYEKYNGSQFGYGGRLGLDEVNCTELVDDAYLHAGVDIIQGDYDSRLKEVLKGNTKNLVLIPDDLMFSGRAEVKEVWKRS